MCNHSYHFPLRLGRHAGVTVHQRLGRLWERVGDTVTETLAQTSSAITEGELYYFLVSTHWKHLIQLCGHNKHKLLGKHLRQRYTEVSDKTHLFHLKIKSVIITLAVFCNW